MPLLAENHQGASAWKIRVKDCVKSHHTALTITLLGTNQRKRLSSMKIITHNRLVASRNTLKSRKSNKIFSMNPYSGGRILLLRT